MEKTVSEASNMPMESQIKVIQRHLEDPWGRPTETPMMKSYYTTHGRRGALQPTVQTVQRRGWRKYLAVRNTTVMQIARKFSIIAAAILLAWITLAQTAGTGKPSPEYTRDGELRLPANYREWVYLSSGFDMSYNPAIQMDHHMFDNVFVNPEAWRAFATSGQWPDQTMLVLEVRGAQSKGSINQKGSFQDAAVMGLEVHVKDRARFSGKWAFFRFARGAATAKIIPQTENCYSCHSDHGAVDTTFVQFYPTLLSIAKEKGTLAAAYQKESESH
jgi:hypothetical protein